MASRQDPVSRKVQLTGGSTYTVSLPKEWAADQGIEAGSTVNIYADGDRLLLTGDETESERRTARIEAAGRDAADLSRCVTAAYVAGCEEIRVANVPDGEQRRAIRRAVAGLVGVEVHAETEDAVVARTMLDVGDLSPEQTLVQMELTALSMHEAAVEAVLDGDDETARRVVRQDDDVDRLFGLICREFQRSLVDAGVPRGDGALTTFDYYAAARQLERVADHAEKIADVADRAESTPPEDLATEIGGIGDRARDVVRRALSGLLDGDDPAELGAVVADAEAVLEDAATLDRTLYERDIADGYLLGTVVDSLVRTTEYGVNVAEAGLQAAMREPEV